MIETITVGVCGFFFFVFVGPEFAGSVFLGGLAFILPNAVFIRFCLRTPDTGSSGNTLAWFFMGETLKIVITIIIFAVCIVLLTPVNIGLMFIGYVVVLLMNMTGLAILMNK